MSWAARLAALSEPKTARADSAKSANSPAKAPIGANGTIGKGIFPPIGRSEADDTAAAHEAEERAAIQAEGDPAVAVPHDLPPSWADSLIEPTIGARCRNCTGSTWWTERDRPRGWRCGCCYPPTHMPVDLRRVVRTGSKPP